LCESTVRQKGGGQSKGCAGFQEVATIHVSSK
jgi:hypothetical protein